MSRANSLGVFSEFTSGQTHFESSDPVRDPFCKGRFTSASQPIDLDFKKLEGKVDGGKIQGEHWSSGRGHVQMWNIPALLFLFFELNALCV